MASTGNSKSANLQQAIFDLLGRGFKESDPTIISMTENCCLLKEEEKKAHKADLAREMKILDLLAEAGEESGKAIAVKYLQSIGHDIRTI